MVRTFDWIMCSRSQKSAFRKKVEDILESGENAELIWNNTHKITFYGKDRYAIVRRWGEGIKDGKIIEAKITYQGIRYLYTGIADGLTKDAIQFF